MTDEATTEEVVKYAADLMRKNYEAVGFLPIPRLHAYAEAAQLWLQYENDDPCGYLVFGNGWPVLKVYQCCIQTDARRAEHASTLIRALIRAAEDRGCLSVALWCADDLESNFFWPAMGFERSGTRDNGNCRGRMHTRWVYRLQSDLFYTHAR